MLAYNFVQIPNSKILCTKMAGREPATADLTSNLSDSLFLSHFGPTMWSSDKVTASIFVFLSRSIIFSVRDMEQYLWSNLQTVKISESRMRQKLGYLASYRKIFYWNNKRKGKRRIFRIPMIKKRNIQNCSILAKPNSADSRDDPEIFETVKRNIVKLKFVFIPCNKRLFVF